MEWESLIPLPPSRQDADGLRVGCLPQGIYRVLFDALATTEAVAEAAPDWLTLAKSLNENRLHGALVPLSLYPVFEGLPIVPGIGLAAAKAPTSERIVVRRGVTDPRVVAVDPAFGPYGALARIVCAARGDDLEFVEGTWDAPGEWDAYVLTEGMPSPARDDFAHHLDLGASWVELTGLPWVYGVWVVGRVAARAPLRGALANAHREAESRESHAIAEAERGGDQSLAQRLRGIRWTCGGDEVASMREFFQRGENLGLWNGHAEVVFC